jgi:hypothetical protein
LKYYLTRYMNRYICWFIFLIPMFTFVLFLYITRAISLLFIVYYPRRSQKPMGAMGKKIYSFFLIKYSSILFLSLSGSLLVRFIWWYPVLLIAYINYTIVILGSLWVLSSFGIDPSFSSLLLPIYNAKTDRKQILQDNKDKSGIYMFKNLINGKQYVGSSNNLRRRFL